VIDVAVQSGDRQNIAQGGMGAVYEVRRRGMTGLGPRLVMKEMSFSMLEVLEPEKRKVIIEAIRREFQLLSKLSHINLVEAYIYFEAGERQYYVMEYLEGKTLENILDELLPGTFLPVERVLTWARQLCDVLDYLHSQSPPIIYRDLKPSNVMEIHADQVVKLFDFGIARFYKPGKKHDTLRFGKDGYLAPEVIAWRSQTNPRTDVYALGVLLHQLLTGNDPQINPFRLPSVQSINPQVSGEVASAVAKACNMDPTRRTPSVRDVLVDLWGADDDADLPATVRIYSSR
jgi:serine/threonine-protein kinase